MMQAKTLPPTSPVRIGLIASCLPCDSEWIATPEITTCFICGSEGVPGRAAEYCAHGVRQGRVRCPECIGPSPVL